MKKIVIFLFLTLIGLSDASSALASIWWYWQQPTPQKINEQKAQKQINEGLDSIQSVIITKCREAVADYVVEKVEMGNILDLIDDYKDRKSRFSQQYGVLVDRELPRTILNLKQYRHYVLWGCDYDGIVSANLKTLCGVNANLQIKSGFLDSMILFVVLLLSVLFCIFMWNKV